MISIRMMPEVIWARDAVGTRESFALRRNVFADTPKMVDISDQVKFKPLKNSNRFPSTSKRGLPLPDLANPKSLVTTDVPASIATITFSTGTLIVNPLMESNGKSNDKIIPMAAPSEHAQTPAALDILLQPNRQ